MKVRAYIVLTFLMLVAISASAQRDKTSQANIDVRDYCDPDSFNASIGPGTCVRDTSTGAITFAGFVAELTTDHSVGAWRFAPQQIRVSEGADLEIHNLGGETHTFTAVKRFGGGFVDFLNGPAGDPIPAPECAQVVNGALVPQPPSDQNVFLVPGANASVHVQHGSTARYQCCIHPWMRLTITPKDEHHEEVH